MLIRLDKAMPKYRADEIQPHRRGASRPSCSSKPCATTITDTDAPLPDELGGGRVRWGGEIDLKHVTAGELRGQIAGYLAKYSTKSTEQAGAPVHRVARDQVATLAVREHVRRYLHEAFALDDLANAHGRPEPQERVAVGPAAQTASDPNALAHRASQAMAAGERVRVRLVDGREHIGRVRARSVTRSGGLRLTLDTGAVIDLDQVKVIAAAAHEPDDGRHRHDGPRLAACAHQLGYRGHCVTKSRRYSTTFKALRQAREQHVHARLVDSDDPKQRALAQTAREERISSFVYAGRGHVTTADAYLAASAAARAREQRRIAREELCDLPPRRLRTGLVQGVRSTVPGNERREGGPDRGD